MGELPHTLDQKRVLKYVAASDRQFNMVFQFEVVDISKTTHLKYDTKPFAYTLQEFKEATVRSQHLLDGTDAWTTVFLENHDQARSISRFGSDDPKCRRRSGKMLAIMLTALSGTCFFIKDKRLA
jgi:glycosidase